MSAAQRPLIAPPASSRAAASVMRGNRKVDSKQEIVVRSLLHGMGLRFRKNHRVVAEGISVRPDVVFPRSRLAVFLDGCYWHRCPVHGTAPRVNAGYWQEKLDRNVTRDRLVDERLRAAGWTVMRIWEHVPPAEAASRIGEALRLWSADPGIRASSG